MNPHQQNQQWENSLLYALERQNAHQYAMIPAKLVTRVALGKQALETSHHQPY
jgi:hypothetical protein